MTRPATTPILAELRSPSSPEAQVAALRALKNEIIGHEQRKELWVGLGVVTPLARVLNTRRSGAKRRQKEYGGEGGGGGKSELDREHAFADEGARLQAILVVGSLAQGGLWIIVCV